MLDNDILVAIIFVFYALFTHFRGVGVVMSLLDYWLGTFSTIVLGGGRGFFLKSTFFLYITDCNSMAHT
jgi:hypothetical protein